MGIIINDTITLRSGIEVTNAYAALSVSDISVRKDTPSVNTDSSANNNEVKWVISTEYSIWYKQDEMKKISSLQRDFIKTTYDGGECMFAVLYRAIKAKYQSTSDA